MLRIFILNCILILLPTVIFSQQFISGHTQAKESILRSIPERFIDSARSKLHIAYQHSSYGTVLSYGLFGLPEFKPGDDTLFAITCNNPIPGMLDLQDYAIAPFAESGNAAYDLTINETAFIQATRNYLDDTINSAINVVVWSWDNIAGSNVTGNYLKGMDSLINEYGINGTNIGYGPNQRLNPVSFIFLTGHANANDNSGVGKPEEQASIITSYCLLTKQYCLNVYSIDVHDMDDNFWPDADANGQSELFGGNFYDGFYITDSLGKTFYENKTLPGGITDFGYTNTQPVTANRNAYAFWWILARIAGWNGLPKANSDQADLNSDMVIDISDLIILMSYFDSNCNCPADINRDNIVSTSDLLILLNDFDKYWK